MSVKSKWLTFKIYTVLILRLLRYVVAIPFVAIGWNKIANWISGDE